MLFFFVIVCRMMGRYIEMFLVLVCLSVIVVVNEILLYLLLNWFRKSFGGIGKFVLSFNFVLLIIVRVKLVLVWFWVLFFILFIKLLSWILVEFLLVMSRVLMILLIIEGLLVILMFLSSFCIKDLFWLV